MPSIQNPFANTATILSTAPGNMAAMQGANAQMLGIMPQQANSSAISMNPGIDLYGGMAMPFTQFVNGVPAVQTQVTSGSASDHPCKGNGGKDCGCGGSCMEAKNAAAE